MPEPLIIYGAGGFARELLELVRDINAAGSPWEVAGFLSDDPAAKGTALNGVPILGGVEVLMGAPGRYHVALGIGSPSARSRIASAIAPYVAGFPTLVHPTVLKSRFVELEDGVIVAAGNILTANIVLSRFTLINLACTIGHDCQIGAFTTLSPGANVSGNVRLGEGCDVGTGTSFVQGVSVGHWSIIGAGAAVARDLPANCTAVGVPAKVIKERLAGWQLEK